MIDEKAPRETLTPETQTRPAELKKPSGTKKLDIASLLLPLLILALVLAVWAIVPALKIHGRPLVEEYALPPPLTVIQSIPDEVHTGRLFSDIVASLFRIGVGFSLAAVLGMPLGLWLGSRNSVRAALLPGVNFFRNLSPLAWIPFAILWFGIGDPAAIFLIFMASFFPLAIATMAAVATIPIVHFRVAKDYGFHGQELLLKVTLPAILPQVITALRVTAGVAWIVVVAAEMVGCKDGLGYGIYDARSALRLDLVALYMIVIGLLGIGLDRLLSQLTRLPGVRWGYER